MSKITSESLAKYTDIELGKIKKFAFAPTGILGVHDFMLDRKIEGVLHIVLAFVVFFFCNGLGETICKSVGNCGNTSEVNAFYNSTLILGVLALLSSYVWALFEGDAIDKTIISRHQPAQRVPSPAEVEKLKAKEMEQKRKSKRSLSVASVVFGAIAAITPILCLLIEKNTTCVQGSCIIIAIPMRMFLHMGIPLLTLLAVIFGLFGIGKKENGKINLLPFLGIFLGILGAFLAWDFLYGHLILRLY